ncbi:HNH endonuclease [Nocardia brasiliensis]
MTVSCLNCSTGFDPSPTGRGPKRKRCPNCASERRRDLQRARASQARALKWGAPTEQVIAREVFERDEWICHICTRQIPKSLRKTRNVADPYEPMAPVIDHVIPLSKSGSNMLDNCRTAHSSCNAKKHNRQKNSSEAARTPARRAGHKTGPTGCSVILCPYPGMTAGMCRAHYTRNRKYDDPLKTKCGCGCGTLVYVLPNFFGLLYIDGHGVQSNIVSPEVKLRANLINNPVSEYGKTRYGLRDDCLIWTGPVGPQGYGKIYLATPGLKRRGRSVLVHRLAYELTWGQGSTSGLTIDHLCYVPLCCNPNHLEAVTSSENIKRSSERINACSKGHPYNDVNTIRNAIGHRRCRQCANDRYHIRVNGHSFVINPAEVNKKRRTCMKCREDSEARVSYCPQGHEYTSKNKRIDSKGKRSCLQCILDRTHVPKFGHSFVIDPYNSTPRRRRCKTCIQATPVSPHCINGHEISETNTRYSKNGHRQCILCELNKRHRPVHGHDYVIDLTAHHGRRRCLICHESKFNKPQSCPAGHDFTAENTRLKNGWRNCRTCERNRGHRKLFDHDFVVDPNSGKRLRCLVCAQTHAPR